jgi:hypothetical protein
MHCTVWIFFLKKKARAAQSDNGTVVSIAEREKKKHFLFSDEHQVTLGVNLFGAMRLDPPGRGLFEAEAALNRRLIGHWNAYTHTSLVGVVFDTESHRTNCSQLLPEENGKYVQRRRGTRGLAFMYKETGKHTTQPFLFFSFLFFFPLLLIAAHVR